MGKIKFYFSQIEDSKKFQNKELNVKLKTNILICFENLSYTQFSDTIQFNWEIRRLNHISDLKNILNEFEEINNIALIYHGGLYSSIITNDIEKIKLNEKMICEYIPNVFDALSNDEKSLDIEIVADIMHERSKFLYKNGIERKYFIGYLYLKKMISSISDNGNYFSIACDEADTDETLKALGNLTEKKIKIFGNTNLTTIGYSITYKYQGIDVSGVGSILNIPLTDSWDNKLGWKYFDTAEKKVVITNKDLVLKGTGKTPYKLIERNFYTKGQDYIYVILYYSKKVKNWFLKNSNEIEYKNWKNEIKKNYHNKLIND